METERMHSCCFLGHRKIAETDELKKSLYKVIENLIIKERVDVFLFGSKSEFDKLCLRTVTELKIKYNYIRRIYVRAEFPHINDEYRKYILNSYDDTYYPQKMINAGRASYVERNHEMINKSRFCVIYYDEKYNINGKSGTKIAFDYAVKKGCKIINLFCDKAVLLS